MDKSAILAAAIVAALLLAGCTIYVPQTIIGSGKTVTLERDESGFNRVVIGSAFRAEITRSEGYSVSLTVDQNVVPYLDISAQGDTLRISIRPGLVLAGSTGPLEARIAMPALRALELSGATRATISGFESADPLDASVSGASRLEGDIEAGDVRLDISGASRVTLRGRGDDLRLEASGASQADLEQFVVTNGTVELSGASRATVNATGRLDVEASGASHLRYAGGPVLGSVKTSGASTIQPQ